MEILPGSCHDALTSRQWQALAMAAAGLSHVEIARRLGAVNTVQAVTLALVGEVFVLQRLGEGDGDSSG